MLCKQKVKQTERLFSIHKSQSIVEDRFVQLAKHKIF
jgi:hypothetical protein